MTVSSGLEVRGAAGERFEEILTPEALDFILRLERKFGDRRTQLLAARAVRRKELESGGTLDFLPETSGIRADPSWRVAPPAPGLIDRRAEITGPTDRKMTVNALNSGAKVWLADFEDANSPTWQNLIGGQLNLRDAIAGKIDFTTPEGKSYAVGDDPATIVVRPRGLHLVEMHLWLEGQPTSASIVDFGLYLFHCAQRQLDRGSGPYFYLPKLEHHLEARWWNDVFVEAQALLGLPRGTIRATTLIETIPAAFQMEEILYELREHSAGLNAGRWDYIFSLIKNFLGRPEFVLPDRSMVVMTVPFMRAYTELLVSTCHRRGAHAIGGMSAFIPSKDIDVNAIAFAKVRDDKLREAGDGFDGSWVAHPGLVGVCREVFDAVLGERSNQLDRQRDVRVSASDLLAVDKTPGQVTLAGVRQNISVALRYLDSWLRGIGAAAIDNLMEDAATAEISRCQISQWLRHRTMLDDGSAVTEDLVRALLDEQFDLVEAQHFAPDSRLKEAREIVQDLIFSNEIPEFLTVGAYARYLV